jgi:ATP-dependent Zn protease
MDNLWNLFLAVLPMLLLIGAWFFFMRQMRNPNANSYQAQCLDAMKRQADACERIAAALEKRQ